MLKNSFGHDIYTIPSWGYLKKWQVMKKHNLMNRYIFNFICSHILTFASLVDARLASASASNANLSRTSLSDIKVPTGKGQIVQYQLHHQNHYCCGFQPNDMPLCHIYGIDWYGRYQCFLSQDNKGQCAN